jgi:hypothetical protein
MDASYWHDQLRPYIEGRRVLLVGSVVASWTPTVRSLQALGARAILVVGTEGRGTGEVPAPYEAAWLAVPVSGRNSMDVIRAGEEVLRNPPDDVRAAVAGFAPTLAFGTFLVQVPEFCGVPLVAYRRREWVALEDKTVVDAFWDRAGVARVRSEVVDLVGVDALGALRSASSELDGGHGVVWSGDAREGMNGGGAYVRWVRDVEDAEAAGAAAFFQQHCDRVRVMPFLEGVPCSIHGVVFDDEVIALRPVEMVVLRRRDRAAFFYAGCASFFDPPASDREVMRSLARTVGARLRAEVAFRGPFTIDGVLTADGFRPTELNPRNGAGLNAMARAISEFPLQLLFDGLVGGWQIDWKPGALETLLVQRFDAARAGGSWALLSDDVRSVSVADLRGVIIDDATTPVSARWARDGEHADAAFGAGPGGGGSFVRFAFEPARTPVGPSVGARAAACWRLVANEFGLELGELEAAQSVHEPGGDGRRSSVHG